MNNLTFDNHMLNTSEINIQSVFPHDVAMLRNIACATFLEAFAEDNTEENLKLYLDAQLSIEQLTVELKEADSEFYVALHKQEVIGYLKINFGVAQNELREKHSMEIERIYVLKEFYGSGIGQMLLDHAIQIGRVKNFEFVWLGVWEENPRAIRFYEKNGFETFDKHIFMLGADPQTDLLMRRQIS